MRTEKKSVFFLEGIKEVVLYTKEPTKLALFYSKTFGYGIIKEKEDILVLLGNSKIRIKEDKNKDILRYHLSFSILDTWIDRFIKHLEDIGINFDKNKESILLNDPQGNKIEIKIEPLSPRARVTHNKNQYHSSPENKWEYIYKNLSFKNLPWYYEDIDFDIKIALSKYIPIPSSILDIGCGPGTQSARLSAIGYKVTAIDIAKGAVSKAKKLYQLLDINFIQKDITDNSIKELGSFDGAIDRGCFHSLLPEQHNSYVENIHSLLKPKGILILKVFSKDEPGNWGPRRFEIEELLEHFLPKFKLVSFEKSAFEGGRSYPKALCLVLEKN